MEPFRCRFVQEPFQGILVQEDEHSALTSLWRSLAQSWTILARERSWLRSN
ncbi:MAG: hypothetical protein ACLR23_20435 [Clostridia bacterium]